MNEDRKSGRGGGAKAGARPTAAQSDYLSRGLAEPGGKLPLFDRNGQRYSRRTIQSCIDRGWARPWFQNPLKPDWLICRLTEAGEAVMAAQRPPPRRRPVHNPRQTRPWPLGGTCDARRLQLMVRDLVEA